MNSKELQLNYPCNWEYKTVLESSYDIKEIVKDVLGDKEHSIKKSNNSKTGKYHSHIVSTLVNSDDERKAIFDNLKNHKFIKFVL